MHYPGIDVPFCRDSIIERTLANQFVESVKGVVITDHQYFPGVVIHRRQPVLSRFIGVYGRLPGIS